MSDESSQSKSPEAQANDAGPVEAIKPSPKPAVDWPKRIRAFQRFIGTEGLVHTHKHGYLDPSNRRDRGMLDG